MADFKVNSAVGVDGNTYTTSIANDKLTNKDFLKLLLKEFELQDPTNPMDSAKMLENQLQMSQIETNMQTVKAMEKLVNASQQSNLSTASNLIDKVIKNGEMGETGIEKEFKVSSVSMQDGEVLVQAREIKGYDKEAKEFILSPDVLDIQYKNITSIHG
jgi:flagellar basal-body rod modification protein FlgD